MIHALLQHRLLGGGGPPPGVVIDPPGWAGAAYDAGHYVTSSTATAVLTFTLKSNGTYTVVGTNGTNITGNWHSAPAVGVGAGFECRYTVTGSAGGVVNGASTFSSLSVDRSFSLTATQPTFGVNSQIRSVLAEIKLSAGAVVASGTFTAEAYAEVG